MKPTKPPETRGGWNRCVNVELAVSTYRAIKKPVRGDMKRIAKLWSVPVSSLATQLRRRANRKEIKYPAQYKK